MFRIKNLGSSTVKRSLQQISRIQGINSSSLILYNIYVEMKELRIKVCVVIKLLPVSYSDSMV